METLTDKEIKALAEELKRVILIEPIGRWLTMGEAKKYAKVKSVKTIKKWLDEGYIYGHKRSGSWIIDRQSIDDWYLSDKL